MCTKCLTVPATLFTIKLFQQKEVKTYSFLIQSLHHNKEDTASLSNVKLQLIWPRKDNIIKFKDKALNN